MSRKLESIEITATLQQAAKKMTNKDISSLIIIDKSNTPVGLVSERDIVRKGCSREDIDIKLATVSEIMSSPVITINHKSSPGKPQNYLLRTR